ncbi:MAG TPA: lytic murein transglycosylase [Xanthobacteraceae bacterium]|nr:lytic murein transglycosylase [Xanthobacteraceae bacterium]
MRAVRSIIVALACTIWAAPALAAGCQTGSFEAWLETFKRETAAKGVSPRGLAALDGVAYDASVVSRDRRQGVFRQSFEEFSGRMISPDRLRVGARKLKQHAATFARIEQAYGVPGPVLVAIWGLETDFGVNQGNFSVIRALASLGYDCRRSEKFQAELMDALRIVERGDLSPHEMRGAWAGEIGQTQFLPSSYLKYAVDFDGDGRRDLIRSVPDALASTANYLRGYGWKRGQGWEPGAANFDVLLQWNKSQVYSKTIAAFATRLQEAR